MSVNLWKLLPLIGVWILIAACSGGPPATEPTPAASGSAPGSAPATADHARALPIPGAAPAAGASNEHRQKWEFPITWSVPQGWMEMPPANNMRQAQYTVTGTGGDSECVVFYFGPGQGGDPQANAQRWAGQFSQPGGGSSLDVMKVTQLESAVIDTHIVEVSGTYDGGMSGSGPADNYLLLGAIVQRPDAPWFFKLIGPESTVREQRDNFIGMMESIRNRS
jgi:hypothetical protein